MKAPRLSKDDMAEGKELMQILESMSAEEKVFARVYLSALTDKRNIRKRQKRKSSGCSWKICAEIRHKEKGERIMTEIEKRK